jgi:hypothetical protein
LVTLWPSPKSHTLAATRPAIKAVKSTLNAVTTFV